MATPLTPQQRAVLTAACPAWSIDADDMRRTFVFADFPAAMAFVTKVALAAERLDHHPDIDIRWNKVTLVLSTHSEGTLTDLDATLARQADEAVAT
jgi:4a-hydroxytetrahydrobiopterin dehydratase